jgi:hypothetical protein
MRIIGLLAIMLLAWNCAALAQTSATELASLGDEIIGSAVIEPHQSVS